MCLCALLPFRPVVRQYCNAPRCCLWQMLTFPGIGTSIPGPDSLERVQYERPNADLFIYSFKRSRPVFFIANVKVRFLDSIAIWRYNIGRNEFLYINKPFEIETGTWTVHVQKEQHEISGKWHREKNAGKWLMTMTMIMMRVMETNMKMQVTFEVLTAVLFNPLNAELNPICPLLALFGAHHMLYVSR